LWNGKNGGWWKSLREVLFCSTFFLFSTTVFHQQQLHKKAEAAQFSKKSKMRALRWQESAFCGIFSVFFPHSKKRQNRGKRATYPTFEPFHSFRRLY